MSVWYFSVFKRKSSPRSTQYKWKGVVSRTVNRVVSKTVKAFLIYNFFDCASVKTAAVKIESYLSFKELAFETRSLKDSKLKLNWWQLIWRNSLIRFYTVFTSRNTKTAACIKNEHYAIGRKNKNKTCVMFIKILSNEMCILHLSQAILNTGWEIYKLLQDPMSHYGSLSKISSGIIVHLFSIFKLTPSSD